MQDSLWKIWRDMVCLSKPYPFKFFKGCLPQNLLSPFLNIFVSHVRSVNVLCLRGSVKTKNINLKAKAINHRRCSEIKATLGTEERDCNTGVFLWNLRDFSEQFFYKTLLSSVCHWTSQLNKLAIPVNLVNSNKFRTENDGPLLKVISFETTGQYETDMIYIFLNLFKTWDQRMYVGLDCKVLRQRRKTC